MTAAAVSVRVLVACDDWARLLPDAGPAAERAVWAALAEAGVAPARPAEVSLVLADDPTVRDLNRRYRGVDRPTNVLSFPGDTVAAGESAPGGAAPPLLLGDVVLAFETVAREAAEQGKPFAGHVAHLIVHGVLHLLGHDHGTEAQAETMEALEAAALARLGVPDPYRAQPECREPPP